MEHIHHVGIILIFVLVNIENLLVFRIFPRLVEYAEHLLKTVVHTAFQSRYLHDYAVVGETLNERVFLALLYHLAVVVEHVVVDINHRLLNVADSMSEKVNGNHWICESFRRVFADVYLVTVLRTQILAEAQGLRVEPCLLQFYKDDAVLESLALSVLLPHGSCKVDAEHGERVACGVYILVRAHLHLHHLFLQQCREDSFRYAFVRHYIFEHGVVNRIGYM